MEKKELSGKGCPRNKNQTSKTMEQLLQMPTLMAKPSRLVAPKHDETDFVVWCCLQNVKILIIMSRKSGSVLWKWTVSESKQNPCKIHATHFRSASICWMAQVFPCYSRWLAPPTDEEVSSLAVAGSSSGGVFCWCCCGSHDHAQADINYMYIYIYICIYTLYIDKVNKLCKHCYILSLKNGAIAISPWPSPCFVPSQGSPPWWRCTRRIGVLDLDKGFHPGHW